MGKNFDVLKKFVKTYVRAFEGAGKLVDAIMRTRTHEDAEGVLDAWAASLRSSHEPELLRKGIQ